MNDLLQQHTDAIVYILCGVIALLASALTFFLKSDRKKFMDGLEKNYEDIQNLRKDVSQDLEHFNTQLNEVRENYNLKFEKVYGKLDAIKDINNLNYIKLMEAIHKVDSKIK